MFYSCRKSVVTAEPNYETLLTQQSDTLTLLGSENGVKTYRFYTPLMERYEMARDPYMEFRYGIDIVRFDSLGNIESTLVAAYAIYYENRKLWEARGNVVGHSGIRTLYTQQLFWDEKTDKVYSNVDSKILDGKNVNIAQGGFVSDSKFEKWEFKDNESRMWVDVSQTEQSDSLQSDSTRVVQPNVPLGENKTEQPVIRKRRNLTMRPVTDAERANKPELLPDR